MQAAWWKKKTGKNQLILKMVVSLFSADQSVKTVYKAEFQENKLLNSKTLGWTGEEKVQWRPVLTCVMGKAESTAFGIGLHISDN